MTLRHSKNREATLRQPAIDVQDLPIHKPLGILPIRHGRACFTPSALVCGKCNIFRKIA